MKSRLAVASAALLAVAAMPAAALQLGQIQVRSALNQPLVAAIPLHPENLAELDGLRVGLASPADFARAGLDVTATDRLLRFHTVTDNNGQQLILVTSSAPVTDPYLDFLVQVDTRQGKEVREFVVLLNPTIATPAPEVQAAPVAGAAVPATPSAPPAPLAPRASAPTPAPAQVAAPTPTRQPAVAGLQSSAQPGPQRPQPVAPNPAPALPHPATAATTGIATPTRVMVRRGDTLSGIASGIAPGSGASLDQVMLALQAANPDAFFKHNINNLRAGAILRVPVRGDLAAQSVAAAAAEVRRQHESWQGVKARPATIVEGNAEEALAKSVPAAVPPPVGSDHLTLAPATGKGAGAGNRSGAAGGSPTGSGSGLASSDAGERDALLSLEQSNSELAERIQRLENISQKTGKLLSLKDSTIAGLQQKLATMQAGVGGGKGAVATPVAVAPSGQAMVQAAKGSGGGAPWYLRPLTWIVGALVLLALITLGLAARRRPAHGSEPAHGPLPDPDDLADAAAASEPTVGTDPEARDPDAPAHPTSGVSAIESGLDPSIAGDPVVAAAAAEDPSEAAVMEPESGPRVDVDAPAPAEVEVADETAVDRAIPPAEVALAEDGAVVHPRPEANDGGPAAVEPVSVATTAATSTPPAPDYGDDPVDIKLDLARAYLDMGDRTGARAMLDEVLAQGSQVQKDEAQRLLGEAAG